MKALKVYNTEATSRFHQRKVHNTEIVEALTEVWHMAHFWVSYGRRTMPGSPMGRSEGFPRRWIG